MKRNETLKQTLIPVIKKETELLIVMVSAPCMAHDMPILMVIIAFIYILSIFKLVTLGKCFF